MIHTLRYCGAPAYTACTPTVSKMRSNLSDSFLPNLSASVFGRSFEW